MCGIAGIISLGNLKPDTSLLEKMLATMKHRGPDDEGIFEEENVALGFVRLSIIDLSKDGHQPMFSDDGRYLIAYNGEIYNYLELRAELQQAGITFRTKTDTEVLLKSYLFWGEKCLDYLNGMWAFVVYDRKENALFAYRDRYGIKPFYYLQNDEMFAFCSEIPPLLGLLKGKPNPDYQSIFDYLAFNRTDQSESTFFKEVKKLQHGMKMVFQHGKCSIKRWYDLKQRVAQAKPFKTAGEFRQLFSSSVGLRLRSDVPVGVCLSGGLDSSSIVSILLHDYGKKDLKTFSAIYKKGQTGDETEYIREFKPMLQQMHFTNPDADSLKHDLYEFIQAQAEPIPSTSPYAQYKVMELAKGNVVVTLDGQGADEELAGYHYFFGFFFKDLLKKFKFGKLISEIIHYTFQHKSLYGIKAFLYFLLPEKYKTSVRVAEKGYLDENFVKSYSSTNAIAGNLYGSKSLKESLLNHFENKLEHLLKWEDLNSMHFSLEARVPFLDYRLVERTLASSDTWAIKKGVTKYILREALKGMLPEKIRARKDKIGFGTPQDEWFRDPDWQLFVEGILNSQSFKSRNIINPAIALKKFHEHCSGRINISKEIWKWIHLELWFRMFIDSEKINIDNKASAFSTENMA